jgi:hypothetical protein
VRVGWDGYIQKNPQAILSLIRFEEIEIALCDSSLADILGGVVVTGGCLHADGGFRSPKPNRGQLIVIILAEIHIMSL